MQSAPGEKTTICNQCDACWKRFVRAKNANMKLIFMFTSLANQAKNQEIEQTDVFDSTHNESYLIV